MFSLRRPTDAQIADFLHEQASQPLSYSFAGQTRTEPEPQPGWNVDRERVLLGSGEAVFEKARAAINSWKMFPPELATIHPCEQPTANLDVGILYWAAPVRLWMLLPARVVYVLDERTSVGGQTVLRFGFANGTLPNHAERGEERFLVEWNEADNSVWYDLLAISEPAHWLARLGYPYARYEQSRFRRLSLSAMKQAVQP